MQETKQQMLQEGDEPVHGKQLPGAALGDPHHTHFLHTPAYDTTGFY